MSHMAEERRLERKSCFLKRKKTERQKDQKKSLLLTHILALAFAITFLHPQILLLLRSAHVSIAPLLSIPSHRGRHGKAPGKSQVRSGITTRSTIDLSCFPDSQTRECQQISVHSFWFHAFSPSAWDHCLVLENGSVRGPFSRLRVLQRSNMDKRITRQISLN